MLTSGSVSADGASQDASWPNPPLDVPAASDPDLEGPAPTEPKTEPSPAAAAAAAAAGWVDEEDVLATGAGAAASLGCKPGAAVRTGGMTLYNGVDITLLRFSPLAAATQHCWHRAPLHYVIYDAPLSISFRSVRFWRCCVEFGASGRSSRCSRPLCSLGPVGWRSAATPTSAPGTATSTLFWRVKETEREQEGDGDGDGDGWGEGEGEGQREGEGKGFKMVRGPFRMHSQLQSHARTHSSHTQCPYLLDADRLLAIRWHDQFTSSAP